MDIDVRLLRSFVSIYERGSLSRAAEQHSCTQAAMSMRLKWLESEIGAALFVRYHHRLEPTFKASEFYARALVVLAAYDEMISATRNTSHRGKLRVGIPDDYALGFLPAALVQAKSALARIEIEIVCGLSANLATALSRHEVDIALVTLASTPANAITTIDVPLKWVMDPDYEPQSGEPIGLAAYPEGCLFRRAMTQALDEADMPWAVLAQSQNRAGIVAALRGKLGVSAMVVGTVPDGVAELVENTWLPALPHVPISILTTGKAISAEGSQLADAIKAVLEQADCSKVASAHI